MLAQNLPCAAGRGELPSLLYVFWFNLSPLMSSLWSVSLASLTSGGRL